MNKKGFTLIELMLVIAIMAIIIEAFWAPIRVLTGLEERRQKSLDYNQRLLMDFLKLEKFNAKRKQIKSAEKDCINFEDGAKLLIDKKFSCFTIKNATQTYLLRSLKYAGDLKVVSSKTYIIYLNMNKSKINSWWRCGENE
jgi:prepilin-type N-terminal cleavage/methylation domain-containing protein